MFLDPTNDVAFRRIFGDENKKRILISFLNSVLEFKEEKAIIDVEIMNPYQTPKIKELKETILDVHCRDKRGVTYIVEMQISKPSQFEKRSLYYTSKAYINQIDKGTDYPRLNQVIFIGIIDFVMFKNKNFLTNHLILDTETLENKFSDFRFCFIELPKFNKEEHELENAIDDWIYFFKNAEKLNKVPENIKEPEIIEAFDTLKEFAWTKDDLELYDKIGIYRQDERGRIEQGFTEGFEKGREKEKLDIAKKMLQKNIAVEIIKESTGLNDDDIKILLNK
jgi:predicted transposase/invertase (TIGR01784 family)